MKPRILREYASIDGGILRQAKRLTYQWRRNEEQKYFEYGL
jgi:hypothetical protein